MSDKHDEQLSALLDGEDVDESVLERILADAEKKSTWQRYQLAGAVMRNEAKPGMNIDISAAVASRVAKEPVVLAPRRSRRVASGNWWRPAASFAVAASVALVTVIGVHNYQMNPTGDMPANSARNMPNNPVFETVPVGGIASPVSFNAIQESPVPGPETEAFQRRQLQSFFLDHQQQLQLNQQEVEKLEAASQESDNGSN